MIGTLHGPWFLCAAVLLLTVVVRWCPRPEVKELWLVGALFMGAATARLVYGLWGPLHVNGQGPLWIRGVLDAELLLGYGPGYAELLGWLRYLAAPPDRAVFAANALLSALSPALLYTAARIAGVGRVGALAVALVLAADAVTVRTAASEAYLSPITALVLAVQVALALGTEAQARGDRTARSLALVAAGLLAAAAARIHPVAYLPLALCPLLVLGAAQPDSWRRRVALTLAAGATIGAIVVLSSGGTIVTALRAPMASQASGGLAPQQMQQHATLLLVLLAAVWSLHRWVTPSWLPLLGIASVLMMLATQNNFQEHPLQKLGYQRLFFPGILLGAAPFLPRRLQSSAWAVGSAALVAAALLMPARSHLGRPTTEQLEYRFLQETLRDMPPDCTLAAVSHAGSRVWDIPSYLVPGAGAQRGLEQASDLERAPGSCLIYVRSSLCSSVEARALCEAVEREARLDRVASCVLPSIPSYAGLPYDRSEVEVVLFRVTHHAVGVSDGAAITPAFAQLLYDRVKPLREADGCTIVRVDTSRFRMTIELQAPSGGEHRVELATAPQASGGWSVVASDAGRRECGGMLAAIERVLGEIGDPASHAG